MRNMGVVMKMDLRPCCWWGARGIYFLWVSVGQIKASLLISVICKLQPGQVTLPLLRSRLLHDLFCSILLAYSRSGSVPVAFSFSNNDLLLCSEHVGQTYKCDLKYPFVFPYSIDTHQGSWLQSMASSTGTEPSWESLKNRTTTSFLKNSNSATGNNDFKAGKHENIL